MDQYHHCITFSGLYNLYIYLILNVTHVFLLSVNCKNAVDGVLQAEEVHLLDRSSQSREEKKQKQEMSWFLIQIWSIERKCAINKWKTRGGVGYLFKSNV